MEKSKCECLINSKYNLLITKFIILIVIEVGFPYYQQVLAQNSKQNYKLLLLFNR